VKGCGGDATCHRGGGLRLLDDGDPVDGWCELGNVKEDWIVLENGNVWGRIANIET